MYDIKSEFLPMHLSITLTKSSPSICTVDNKTGCSLLRLMKLERKDAAALTVGSSAIDKAAVAKQKTIIKTK